jgi:hypothetical protein
MARQWAEGLQQRGSNAEIEENGSRFLIKETAFSAFLGVLCGLCVSACYRF